MATRHSVGDGASQAAFEGFAKHLSPSMTGNPKSKKSKTEPLLHIWGTPHGTGTTCETGLLDR